MYDREGNLVRQREYSVQKTQNQICIEAYQNLRRIRSQGNPAFVALKASAGSGKSLIALNIAKEYEKVAIVVPKKNLQNQYLDDYYGENAKFKIMKNGREMRIATKKGRTNFECPYYPGHDCDNDALPCKIKTNDTRKNVAIECPYWSPLLPREDYLSYEEVEYILDYKSINNATWYYYKRGECPYYNQHEEIAEADVVIYNSKIFEIDYYAGKLPQYDLVIIDEADYWLDELKREHEFNLKKMEEVLNKKGDKISNKNRQALTDQLQIMRDKLETMELNEPQLIREEVRDFLDVVKREEFSEVKGIKSHANEAQVLSCFPDEILYYVKTEEGFKTFVLEVSAVLKSMMNYLPEMIGMSYTFQDYRVMDGVFGLKSNEIGMVTAEELRGTINQCKIGSEIDCSSKVLKDWENKKKYFDILKNVVKACKGQTLFHIIAYSDIPKYEYGNGKLPSLDKIREKIQSDNNGTMLQAFKMKQEQILFSTKDMRGTDLPDDLCENVIFSKLPYPYFGDPFFKALRDKSKALFWLYYQDKMQRELWQGLTRGLRSPSDSVNIWSPDSRVHTTIQMSRNKFAGITTINQRSVISN